MTKEDGAKGNNTKLQMTNTRKTHAITTEVQDGRY